MTMKQKLGLWFIRLGEKLCIRHHKDSSGNTIIEGVVAWSPVNERSVNAPAPALDSEIPKRCQGIGMFAKHNFGKWIKGPGYDIKTGRGVSMQARECKDCGYIDSEMT